MSPERKPKRARKKAAAQARRQAQLAAARRRRQRRIMFLVALTAVVVLGGLGFALLGDRDPDEVPVADTEPTRQPAEDPTPPPDPEPDDRPVACGGERPTAIEEPKPSFEDGPEDQSLSPDTTYLLRLETSCGTIDIELAVADAPVTTNSVAFLARQGFYDGLTFHRIVPGFVIQGGDPVGDGTGGSGYRVEEAPPEDLMYRPGVVAMAKAPHEASGTSGSQFFIASGEDAEALPPDYAYVGDVVAGMDVVAEIEGIGTDEGVPPEVVYIEQATIVER